MEQVILRVIEFLRRKIKCRYPVSSWTQVGSSPTAGENSISVLNKDDIRYEQLGLWYEDGR